jgi:hypothetical protein
MLSIKLGSMRFLASGLVLACSGVAVAASDAPTITHSVTPQTASNDVSAAVTGSGKVYTYHFTVYDGGSLDNVSIPVKFCLDDIDQQSTNPWASVTYSVPSAAGNLPGVTTSSSTVAFTRAAHGDATPICDTADIVINTGTLNLTDPSTAQTKIANLNNFSVSGASTFESGSRKLNLNPTGNGVDVHIKVDILPAQPAAHCYITDSSGMLLSDCQGRLVADSGSDDGRFAIVTNKKGIAVATNPGQFYYNVTWLNSTGAAQVVDVAFDRANVTAHGAQAIHAAVFAPAFSGITQENFNLVNDAIPGGAQDAISGITVPAGWTLWVNYHLEWAGVGGTLAPSCTGDCNLANPDGVGFSVAATISNETVDAACSSGAWGFRKK